MLGKIDCRDMFEGNDGHLRCVHTNKLCYFVRGENNGMKCGSYVLKHTVKEEPIDNAGVHDLRGFNEDIKFIDFDVEMESKGMQIKALTESLRKTQLENKSLKNVVESLKIQLKAQIELCRKEGY